MKGCLKLQSTPRERANAVRSPRKSVVFDSDPLDQVFTADEWDRTPMEPSRKLSYQDLLELKEIQRSLPIANQPADDITGRSGSHYLSNVPIGLLPLLPESTPSSPSLPPTSPSPRRTSAPMAPGWASFGPNSHQCPLPATPPLGGLDARLHPRNLSHLPPAPAQAPKPKPRFAFLPLLDNTPEQRARSPSPDFSASDTDPPTPTLTNASLDNSPLSRASSCSPEPPFFQLPPSRSRSGYMSDDTSDCDHTSYSLSPKVANMRFGNSAPPYGYHQPLSRPALTKFVPPPPPRPIPKANTSRKRNVMYINGMEIDIDDDDDDDEIPECSTPPAFQPLRSLPRAPSIPSTSPPMSRSPPLRWQTPPNESPFSGLHAPVRFKRQTPSSPPSMASSPPSPRARRGSLSLCSSKMKNVSSPRSSPILVPRA